MLESEEVYRYTDEDASDHELKDQQSEFDSCSRRHLPDFVPHIK